MEVYKAISAVMAVMAKEGISKDRKNQQQGYNFRGIDDIYASLGGVLAKEGLMMLPRVVGSVREERQTQRGGLLIYTSLTVEFVLVSASDGSKHTICTVGEAMDSADKSSNKAMSAALKYAALQVFMIPTEGENDADAVTHEVQPIEKQAPKNEESRKAYKALQDELRQQKSVDDLTRWSKDAEIQSLMGKIPEDWKAELRAEWAKMKKGFEKDPKNAGDAVQAVLNTFEGSRVINETHVREQSPLEAG